MDQTRNSFDRRKFLGTLAAAPLAITAAMAHERIGHAPFAKGRFVPVMIALS